METVSYVYPGKWSRILLNLDGGKDQELFGNIKYSLSYEKNTHKYRLVAIQKLHPMATTRNIFPIQFAD